MSKDHGSNTSTTPEERVARIADLIVTALMRLHRKDLGARGFSEKVGVDNKGETRVYDHPLESRRGRL